MMGAVQTTPMTRLVQLEHEKQRRVALVDEPQLWLLAKFNTVYDIATAALAERVALSEMIRRSKSADSLVYDDVYEGSDWRLLPPVDHPADPSRCLVSGTGLTHMGSAAFRNAMHGKTGLELTDSMRMFKAGVDGGKPREGEIGTPPEWFYKGSGHTVRGHLQPLTVPPFALDGGEEAEIAGIYIIDTNGRPRRIGMAAGNEFSDHRFEKLNYLNLASSKLRVCAIGPELVIDPAFDDVRGGVSIERAGKAIWNRTIATGAEHMCHSLANLEHHHFKFEAHRRPGDLHVHFFGADSLSFGDGIELCDGDTMVIQFENFGRALRNPVQISYASDKLIAVEPV
jgi:hypothetical protein